MVQDAMGHVIKTQFDDLGRKIQVDDPNMGTTTYQYNAYGEVVKSQDAKQLASGVANYTHYDELGRVVRQYANTGANLEAVNGQVSYRDTFDYVPGRSYLDSSQRDSNESDNSGLYLAHKITYGYADEFARVTNQLHEITDAKAGYEDVAFNIALRYYDNNNSNNPYNYNLLKQTIYTIPGRDVGYSVVNEYDVFGSLTRQRENPKSDDPENPDGELMRNVGWNERGQPLEMVFNNEDDMRTLYDYYAGTGQVKYIINDKAGIDQRFDYQYDAWGNLSTQELNGSITETFEYDKLQRLIKSTVDNPVTNTTIPINYGYDKLGNLTKKSDYSNDQKYNGSRPNAIVSSEFPNNGGTKYYYYDPAGNRNRDVFGGVENTYEYDANHLLTYSHSPATNEAIEFRYGSDNQRYFRSEVSVDQAGEDTIESTFYGGSAFELIRNDRTDETLTKFHVTDYLTVTRQDNLKLEKHFMQKDRLGSTTQILDVNGAKVATKGYDAFGKPRNGDDWSKMIDPALNFEELNASTLTTDVTKRGFTGHEHLDNFELIHMNGRMYDFNNGRFLSVDPFIQGVTSQAINPYSYIGNNPLSGTDPTGYLAEFCGHGGSCEDLAKDVKSIELNKESGEITAVTADDRVSLSAEQAGSVVAHIQVTNGGFNTNALGSLAAAATGAFDKTIADINPKARGNSNLVQNITEGVKGVIKSAGGAAMLLSASSTGVGESADLFRFNYLNEEHTDENGNISVSSTEIAGKFASPGGAPDPEDEDSMDPNSIRFSQDSIKSTFRDGRSIDKLANGLRNGSVKPQDVPAIRLVNRNGRLVTIDNRRLEAFRRAGKPIRTRMATQKEIIQAQRQGKFSAGKSGTQNIRVRGGK